MQNRGITEEKLQIGRFGINSRYFLAKNLTSLLTPMLEFAPNKRGNAISFTGQPRAQGRWQVTQNFTIFHGREAIPQPESVQLEDTSMNDEDTRTHQMLIRAREFMAQSINDFAEAGVARTKFANLQTGITNFEQKAAAHGTGLSEARQGTKSVGQARNALQDRLELIRGIARVMGLADKFPRPQKDNDDSLLQTADIYATHAATLTAEFIAHEMPADFLTQLAAEKAALQTALAGRANAVGDHISAREELDNARDDCVTTVRELTPLIKVKYANNPGKLAEWGAASHIERPAKKAKAAEPPVTPSSKPEDK